MVQLSSESFNLVNSYNMSKPYCLPPKGPYYYNFLSFRRIKRQEIGIGSTGVEIAKAVIGCLTSLTLPYFTQACIL